MTRYGALVIAAGALGMAGFVVAGSVFGFGWIGLRTYLAGATASLLVYALSLLIGQLGAPRVGR